MRNRGTSPSALSSVNSGVWMPGSRRIRYFTSRCRSRFTPTRKSMVAMGAPRWRARARSIHAGEPRGEGLDLEVGRELAGVFRRVGEREGLGGGVDEEVERVHHRHVGDEVDHDLELLRLLREDQARDPVAVGVLLPVEEVLRGPDGERVASMGVRQCAAGRSLTSCGRDPHRAVEGVAGAVVERDLDRHGGDFGFAGAPGMGARITRASRGREARRRRAAGPLPSASEAS